MPGLRARLTNACLRRITKAGWRKRPDIESMRRHAARMDARIGGAPPGVPTISVEIAGVPAVWVGAEPLAQRGVLLYLHGGAWCMNLPSTYLGLAARLSQHSGMRVLLVNYRLAPEHPFPAGADDCLAVYRALVEAGVRERAFVIAGDSAGGNLTLATLMSARDLGLPLPDCAALLSPATDLTLSGASLRSNAAADPMFSLDLGERFPNLYCAPESRRDPRVSPLFGTWDGLPPLLFHVGSTEILLDDSRRAHQSALQAGTPSELKIWIDLPHVFHAFRWLPESAAAIAEITQFIGRHPMRNAPAHSHSTSGRGGFT
jgi:acetyl esterase/lipase